MPYLRLTLAVRRKIDGRPFRVHTGVAVLNTSSILTSLMLVPCLGGLAILALPPGQARRARPVALAVALLTFLLSLLAASWFDWTRVSYAATDAHSIQLAFRFPWIPSLGAQYFVGVDGISLPLVLLTTAVSLVACWASYGVTKSPKAYFALLLFLLAGMIGTFISLDLLLFYVFFEVSLFPMYFLIGIWGGPRKEYAAIKFFLYTLLGSIGILIAILGIYFYTRGMGPGGPNAGVFDVIRLATDPALHSRFMEGGRAAAFGNAAFWLLFVGFAVKIPAVPLHTWLPDAHVEAPTPVSMILAAVLLKMGAYGLLRISYPIFSAQAADNWFWVGLIGVVSIVYGAFVALAQRDFKRLVAYSSVSHMGYVLLGLAVINSTATAGALFQMLAHGISSAMMFFIVGVLYDRAHHRDIPKLGGLWSSMPTYTGWAAVGFFASMGLPGLCGFVGELLVLLGVFSAADPHGFLARHSFSVIGVTGPLLWFGALAAGTIVITAAYHLWTLQRVYMGAPKPEHQNFARLTGSEKWILAILGLSAIALGVLPALVLEPLRPAVEGLMRLVTG
ncbi:MAG TPA: NADH-quinone oxidoreductase subunit M [Phycisphaerae bacterium]|nr:NADH-quinone oxidoreductase subunit M [Phycisphaerae bacterium]